MNEIIAQCEHCNAKYARKKKTQRFCSKRCGQLYRYRADRIKMLGSGKKRQRSLSKEKKRELSEKFKVRYHSNLEKYREISRRANRGSIERLRQEAFEHYGRSCAHCGEKQERFLTIDHIHDDGGQHRRAVGNYTYAILLDLKKRGWPQGFVQFLCFNCNAKKQRLTQKKGKVTLRKLVHEAVVAKYGGRCACCGEVDKDVLQVHPLLRRTKDIALELGNGILPTGRDRLLTMLYNEPRRDDFTIFCVNCNHHITNYGQCPHSFSRNYELMTGTEVIA